MVLLHRFGSPQLSSCYLRAICSLALCSRFPCPFPPGCCPILLFLFRFVCCCCLFPAVFSRFSLFDPFAVAHPLVLLIYLCHTQMHTHIIYLYTHTHVYIYLSIYLSNYLYPHLYLYLYLNLYIYIYTYIHTYICILSVHWIIESLHMCVSG